jgi:DNA-binding GntR family transcriptional regulator
MNGGRRLTDTANVSDARRTPLAPIEREDSLGDRAYSSLKSSLIGGEFRPYDKLTVRGVAAALQVSTTPARDAITRLVAEGALEFSGPKTVIVPPLTQEALDELTVLRIDLECLAVTKSIANISADDITSLESFNENFMRFVREGNYGDLLRWNREFHFLIYRRARLPKLVGFIENLWLRVIPSYHELYPVAPQTPEGAQNHRTAIEALAAGDGDAARAAIEKDILGAYHRLTEVLKARSSERPKR